MCGLRLFATMAAQQLRSKCTCNTKDMVCDLHVPVPHPCWLRTATHKGALFSCVLQPRAACRCNVPVAKCLTIDLQVKAFQQSPALPSTEKQQLIHCLYGIHVCCIVYQLL
jgi:hypothetical protein